MNSFTIISACLFLGFLYYSCCVTRTKPAQPPKIKKKLATIAADLFIRWKDSEVAVSSKLVEAVQHMEKDYDVVLLAPVREQSEEKVLKQEISKLPILKNQLHRIICFEKSTSRVAIVRQLQPACHFEHDSRICKELTDKIPLVIGFESRSDGVIRMKNHQVGEEKKQK